MSGKGWFSIDRSIADHWLWQRRPFSEGQAWIDLILLANHKDERFYSGGKFIDGKRGCVYRSYSFLAERWGWSRPKVTRFIRLLETDKMITTDATRHGTTITLLNYSNYQDYGATNVTSNDATDEQQSCINRATTVQPPCTYNNYNNSTNIGIGNNFTSMAEAVGPVPLPSQNDLDMIVSSWNQIPHAIRLSGIAPMTKRYDKLREAIAIVGMDGVMQAIQSVKDSDWLKERGHVAFDRWITPDHIQSLIEGQYQNKFEKKEEAVQYGSNWDFKISEEH